MDLVEGRGTRRGLDLGQGVESLTVGLKRLVKSSDYLRDIVHVKMYVKIDAYAYVLQ